MSDYKESINSVDPFAALYKNAPKDVVDAFKEARAFFDGGKIVDWIADLYDSDIGGFYYSNSARDNEPYRPDLESTAFAMSFLTLNGAIKDRNAELPENMKRKMVEFVKNLQSPEDGYFYHPQWPAGKENNAGDRYGRDIANAQRFIPSFEITDDTGVRRKQYPKWCIPGADVKCEIHDGTDKFCEFPIVGFGAKAEKNRSETNAQTNSATRPLNVPDYSSAEAFRAWLERYNSDIFSNDNSGNAHSIAELRYEILQHGYADVVLDYLDEVQEKIFNEQIAAGEKPSGMFQRSVNYRAAWGFFKYMAIYNLTQCHRRINIKYVPYIVDSYIEIIKMPPNGDYFINDLMNQWLGVERLIGNVKKYYGDIEVENIRKKMRANAAEMIKNSLEKIRSFKIEDGSFSYYPDGHSISVIYSTPISWGCREGDLNSVILATNMYRAMYNAFGYNPVPLCSAEDAERFVKRISEKTQIVKSSDWLCARDFEKSGDMSFVRVKAKDCGIVADPENEKNQVLRFASESGISESLSFTVLPLGFGTNVADLKMLISPASDNGEILRAKLEWSTYSILISRDGESILIQGCDHTGKMTEKKPVASVGEWFSLRLDFYHSKRCDGKISRLENGIAKIAVNGSEVISQSVECPPWRYVSFALFSNKEYKSEIYIDDCYLAAEG